MFPSPYLRLAEVILADARAQKLRIATAESCTGGLIAALLTEIPGSSDAFDRGFVVYSNRAKSDLLGVPVIRPQVTETTALGAAYLAGLATGFWNGESELQAQRQNDVRFEPNQDTAAIAERRNRWKEAVQRSRRWNV